MIIISHRGNLNGSNPYLENEPRHINQVLSLGFDIKVDVWFINGKYYLGNINPLYEVQEDFLYNEKIWCHAKNLEALEHMLLSEKIHCFWHENDKTSITNKNILWLTPGIITKTYYPSIIVMPELIEDKINKNTFGICTDYPLNYKNILM